jgi:hypothetical protein
LFQLPGPVALDRLVQWAVKNKINAKKAAQALAIARRLSTDA